MKILHLEAGTHVYGGALQVLLLVKGLVERGVETTLVVPAGSAVEEEAKMRKLPVRGIPLAGEADPLFPFRFRRILREEAPDLVHLHSRRGADTLGAATARWAGIPTVLSRRVDNPENGLVVGPKYRLYDAVITISEAIRTVLLEHGIPPEKVRCVHSALDPKPFQRPCDKEAMCREFGLDLDDRIVGMAAQFIPRKGHEILLEAIPSVISAHPTTHFLLFGQGPLQNRIKARIEEMGLDDAVHLTGFREDLPQILPCLDLLVHPAHMEGLGIILLQASAAGVPIVASAAGGIPEAVVDGENGLLIPPADPEALARAVITLLSDRVLSETFGENGRRRVQVAFSPESMVDGNLTVYRHLLGN